MLQWSLPYYEQSSVFNQSVFTCINHSVLYKYEVYNVELNYCKYCYMCLYTIYDRTQQKSSMVQIQIQYGTDRFFGVGSLVGSGSDQHQQVYQAMNINEYKLTDTQIQFQTLFSHYVKITISWSENNPKYKKVKKKHHQQC